MYNCRPFFVAMQRNADNGESEIFRPKTTACSNCNHIILPCLVKKVMTAGTTLSVNRKTVRYVAFGNHDHGLDLVRDNQMD